MGRISDHLECQADAAALPMPVLHPSVADFSACNSSLAAGTATDVSRTHNTVPMEVASLAASPTSDLQQAAQLPASTSVWSSTWTSSLSPALGASAAGTASYKDLRLPATGQREPCLPPLTSASPAMPASAASAAMPAPTVPARAAVPHTVRDPRLPATPVLQGRCLSATATSDSAAAALETCALPVKAATENAMGMSTAAKAVPVQLEDEQRLDSRVPQNGKRASLRLRPVKATKRLHAASVPSGQVRRAAQSNSPFLQCH